MGLLTAHLPDDRGRRVPIINMYGRRAGAARHEGFTKEEFKRIQRFLFQRSATTGPYVAVLVIVVTVTVLAGLWTIRLNATTPFERGLLVALRGAIIAVLVVGVRLVQSRLDAKRMRAELI